jgi:CRISPR-associated protein Csx10
LPLPQVQSITAGSVFVFDGVAPDVERARALEFEGLGERRNEGFGRIAINWLDNTRDFEGKKYQQENYSTDDIKLHNASSIGLAKLMAERLLRQEIEEKLLGKVSQLQIKGSITNSQLSRLSAIALKALQEDSPQLILQLLDNLPNNAKGQFSRSYLEGKPLDQCLRQWVSNPRGCWTEIRLVRIAGEPCDLTNELAREYMLRLIMAVCKKTNKERNYDKRTA